MADRLLAAASPYLRAHAGNPVDWWPWGPEAFAEAERRQVPVMVSIGYATCHWCHVMARESFEDADLAAFLNANFVAIKVDREEHPEVDRSFLAAAAAFTPQLGWPLTVFTTPAGGAFYAGTYWPPVPHPSMPAFGQVLQAVLDAWANRRAEVEASGAAIAEALSRPAAPAAGELPGPEAIAAAVASLEGLEDPQHGGFGGGPKFPSLPVLRLLVEQGSPLGERMLDAVERHLVDPLDGGVYRYATQRDWSEPHYERMLYDNAQLLAVAALAGRAELAERVAGYLLGTLRLPSMLFAAGQDSESLVGGDRVEGGWHRLDAAGRAASDPPPLDRSVLTGWNGLAIEALALAGARLGRPEWLLAAELSAEALREAHCPDLLPIHSSLDGAPSAAPATLEDHGMLALGLLELGAASGDPRHLSRALRLVVEAVDDEGGLRPPGGGDPVLAAQGLAAPPDPEDSALPSGWSSVAAAAERLSRLSSLDVLGAAARAAMRRVAGLALQQPVAFGTALSVMARLAGPQRQLVVVDGGGDPELVAQARRLGGTVVGPGQAAELAASGFELFEGRGTEPGVTTAYLCEGFVCRLPVTDWPALEAQLGDYAAEE